MTVPVEVLVTGLGATTPLGGDVASSWAALLDRQSGVSRLDDDWAPGLPARLVARCKADPAEQISRVAIRRLDRSQQLALIAAREAWAHAGTPQVDPVRLAVVIGTGVGGAQTLLDQDDILEESGVRRVSPHTVPMLMPNGPAATVGLEFGAEAGVHAVVSACASGAEALSLGLDIIRSGRADVVIAGGTESCIHPLPLAGFAQMRALSTRNDEPAAASRPFDKGRDGFVLGEGAGVLVLERAEFARARGATPLAVLAGAGISADAYDLVQPRPDGGGGARAIALALRDAGIAAADVGHVNAHATSTPVGDTAEATAIRSALGDHTLVTATKSMTGHMLGAAGAVETIFALLALRHQIVPAVLNLDDPDDAEDVQALDIVRHEPRQAKLEAVVNDSFGFGGHNVALALTRV
ncbi:MAG: beta-ketoacyl-[acyl-carrier-protein] synthase family protein [Geodermatophilaceae bacterium]|nr:beta-ketoacyl-[acyl-carrier-protein] synthase family protein [Geodermatophilaceae bacterium]MDQ3465168.1 beta-ketoacyl-[acyl-carrier-protein] synthase family protein [Actinomycetota bacterium]